MNRCFLSNNKACRGGCLYCFSKWQEYKKFEMQSLSGENIIIYPNCDGDIFDDNFKTVINELLNLHKKYSLSISTKFRIDEADLQLLRNVHDSLCDMKKGIVKLSVSFSCSDSIENIEPRTANYDERIQLIKQIFNVGLPYVTIIKPILPFIDCAEYYQIIDDTMQYSPYYLLGDLYVSESTSFYKTYISDKYSLERRNVNWNGLNGPWNVIVDREKRTKIIDYIISRGGKVFESDKDVMEYILNLQKCKEK